MRDIKQIIENIRLLIPKTKIYKEEFESGGDSHKKIYLEDQLLEILQFQIPAELELKRWEKLDFLLSRFHCLHPKWQRDISAIYYDEK